MKNRRRRRSPNTVEEAKEPQERASEVQIAKRVIISSQEDYSQEAAVRTQQELNAYEKHELRVKEAELQSLKNDIWARKIYSGLIFLVVVVWLGFILHIVIYTGCDWYRFSDTVLVALITTTTLNIIGLFLAVTQYLFPKPNKD